MTVHIPTHCKLSYLDNNVKQTSLARPCVQYLHRGHDIATRGTLEYHTYNIKHLNSWRIRYATFNI